jgi:hypothetical protein
MAMAVRARVTPARTERPARDEREIEALISRGGMPAPVAEQQVEQADTEIKFTLRLAKAVMDQIDTAIRTRPGKVSRNQWIVEAIAERLHQQVG